MQPRPDEQSAANDVAYLAERIDEIIAEHGGDALAAVRTLLERVAYLEAARDRALDMVSRGYARGRLT